MKIFKGTKKIGEGTLYATLLQQTIGLMFSLNKKIVIFQFNQERKVSIHTWFMFFYLDLIYLNKKKKIVEIKRNLHPFSLFKPQKKASYIIEAPSGFVRKYKLKEHLTLQLR